jgi:hypothetical protein
MAGWKAQWETAVPVLDRRARQADAAQPLAAVGGVMPKAMHRALAKTAKKRGYSKERSDRYVYGTMAKKKAASKKRAKKR